MLSDPWLQRWLPLLAERAAKGPVLEIGCGHGDDTSTLAAEGFELHSFDLSPVSVAAARLRVPSAHIDCRDLRGAWPLASCPAVVASLSLHYFPWDETLALVERVRQALPEGGVFLCRLNSTEDHHFGASGHPLIEPNYFMVDGSPKRFFDRAAVDALFSRGWTVRSCEHFTTRKYLRAKALWEVVAERAGGG